MMQILSRRAWVSLALLPVAGVIGTLLAYAIMSLLGGRGALLPQQAVTSVLIALAGVLLGVALWPIVLFRARSGARIAGYGALAAVAPVYWLLTPTAASWSYPSLGGNGRSVLAPLTVALIIMLAAGCGLLIARLTLAGSPWYPGDERGVRVFRRRAFHLFWSVPLAAFIAAPAWIIGGISLCGISGCSGGGFGRYTADQVQSWISCGVVGVIFALAVGLVPWIRPGSVRVWLGVAAGLATGGGQALLWLSVVWYL